jgi:transcriptional regulator with XRE-family HTH domain
MPRRISDMKFGDRLRQVIAGRGTNPTAVAGRMKTTPQNLSNFLAGDDPKLETLHKLAVAIPATLDELGSGIDPAYDQWVASRDTAAQITTLVTQLDPAVQEGLLRFVQSLIEAKGRPTHGLPRVDTPESQPSL